VDHDALGVALKKAIYNFMHGIGLEQDVRGWFDGKVPKTRAVAQLCGAGAQRSHSLKNACLISAGRGWPVSQARSSTCQ
jgi:hypothetical protein